MHAALLLAIAFVAPVDGVWQVWLAGTGRPAPVTREADDVIDLSASPAGDEMLAVTRSGVAVRIAASGEPLERFELGAHVDAAALSPDGMRVAYAAGGTGGGRDADLWLLDRRDGSRVPLDRGAGGQRSPAWSPDARALVYTGPGPGGGEDVYRLELDTGSRQQLTVGEHRHFEPVVDERGVIWVSSDRGGDYDLWRIDPVTGEVERAVGGPDAETEPAVAEGEGILFVRRRAGTSSIWLAAEGGEPSPVLEPGVDVRRPVWLADAAPARAAVAEVEQDWIAFLRVEDGGWRAWAVRPDGSGLRQLPALPSDPARITVTRDGTTLLAATIDGSIHAVDLARGTVREVVVEPAWTTDAAISPDGKQIAYSTNTLGGIDSNDLWVVSIDGGRARKVTSQDFLQHHPSWLGAGALLYLSGRGGQTHDLWKVDLGTLAVTQVLGDHLYNFDPSASEGGDIAFSSNLDGNYDVWLLRAGAAKPPVPLTRDPAYDGQPALSPSGERLAYVTRRGGEPSLRVLDVGSMQDVPVAGVEGEIRSPVWFRWRGEGAR